MVSVKCWYQGHCSLYAVVRNDIVLADEFLDTLERSNWEHAAWLASFIDNASKAKMIRPALLRDERPDLGIYAMRDHKAYGGEYNPSRLLCSFIDGSNRILVVGAGFIKKRNQSIQQNSSANQEAKFLRDVVETINARIAHGEIEICGSILKPDYPDSFDLH